MTFYKQVQIIKHALMHYIERPGATEKEIEEEKKVLDIFKDKAESLKERYRIK